MPATPLPYSDPLIELDPRTGKPAQGYPISKSWGIYLQDTIAGPIATSVQTFPAVTLIAQSAAIGVTPIPLPTLPTGLYRLTYYARITTPASVNSSLTVSFAWTESGVSLSASAPAITGNTVTTVSSASLMILIDGASAISYSTAYVSNVAGMAYRLSILVEAMGS